MKLEYICPACKAHFDNTKSLSLHIRHKHYSENYTGKEFYDDYLKKDVNEGICKTCGKPTRFIKFSKGYKTHCSPKCAQNDPYVRKAFSDHCEEKYGVGVSNPMKAKEVFEKFIDKNGKDFFKKNSIKGVEKYIDLHKSEGFINPFQDPEVISKIQETNLKKYGVKYATVLKEFTDKAKRTNLRKYNTATPQLSNRGMTKPEKKVYEFLKNRKFDFRYQYLLNGKNFDFAIFKDGKLAILIEIDGEYFHGLLSDCDGKHSNGSTDHERFIKVPPNVKFLVADSLNIDKLFSEILENFNIDYDTWIKRIIDSLPVEFPFPEYSKERMFKDYDYLCRKPYNQRSMCGISIIQNFHKSIWYGHKKNMLSPVECWKDRNMLETVVRNRFIYKSVLSSQNIAKGFNICSIAKTVSVFNPMLARDIIENFLYDVKVIFDPFSGFSGRMLGACAKGKAYLGQALNPQHFFESNEIIRLLGLNASVIEKDIFTSSGTYESLFTCPPYYDKEIWNDKETILSCDEWIDICLARFDCKIYLFVVDETEKYKSNIVRKIENKSHFGTNYEYLIKLEKK